MKVDRKVPIDKKPGQTKVSMRALAARLEKSFEGWAEQEKRFVEGSWAKGEITSTFYKIHYFQKLSQGDWFLFLYCVGEGKVHSSQSYSQKDENNPSCLLLLGLAFDFGLYFHQLFILFFPSDLFQSLPFFFIFLSLLLLIFLLFSHNFFLLFSFLHLHLQNSFLLLILSNLFNSGALFIFQSKVKSEFLAILFQNLADGLFIFDGSLVEGGVALVILMIDEKLFIQIGQQRIFLQFIEYGHDKISLVLLGRQHKAGIPVAIEFSGVVDRQFLKEEVEIIAMPCLDTQIEVASIFLEGLVNVDFVGCQFFEDVFVGLVADCRMKHSLSC